ncbi:hypothetical protein KSP39_PZI017373 [Platanthera zijinensis]|uniref:Bet v I/Major latex protein domain-containing protein n=1 Tax=Platanthera zijinensis TaxID=2320716 RepID=A0AAP0B572_9ASPA
MVKGSFSDETLYAVNVDRAWNAFVIDAHNLLPKILPDIISQAVIVEGDGGIGTVYNIDFTQAVSEFRFVKHKVVGLDSDCYKIEDAVVDGGYIGSRLKSYIFVQKFEEKFEEEGEGSTVVKLTVEYETLDEKPLSVEEQKELIEQVNVFRKAIEGYLQAHPTAYV